MERARLFTGRRFAVVMFGAVLAMPAPSRAQSQRVAQEPTNECPIQIVLRAHDHIGATEWARGAPLGGCVTVEPLGGGPVFDALTISEERIEVGNTERGTVIRDLLTKLSDRRDELLRPLVCAMHGQPAWPACPEKDRSSQDGSLLDGSGLNVPTPPDWVFKRYEDALDAYVGESGVLVSGRVEVVLPGAPEDVRGESPSSKSCMYGVPTQLPKANDVFALARHTVVAGTDNWSPQMNRFLGGFSRVEEFVGWDAAGCLVARVSADAGAAHRFVWRVSAMEGPIAVERPTSEVAASRGPTRCDTVPPGGDVPKDLNEWCRSDAASPNDHFRDSLPGQFAWETRCSAGGANPLTELDHWRMILRSELERLEPDFGVFVPEGPLLSTSKERCSEDGSAAGSFASSTGRRLVVIRRATDEGHMQTWFREFQPPPATGPRRDKPAVSLAVFSDNLPAARRLLVQLETRIRSQGFDLVRSQVAGDPNESPNIKFAAGDDDRKKLAGQLQDAVRDWLKAEELSSESCSIRKDQLSWTMDDFVPLSEFESGDQDVFVNLPTGSPCFSGSDLRLTLVYGMGQRERMLKIKETMLSARAGDAGSRIREVELPLRVSTDPDLGPYPLACRVIYGGAPSDFIDELEKRLADSCPDISGLVYRNRVWPASDPDVYVVLPLPPPPAAGESCLPPESDTASRLRIGSAVSFDWTSRSKDLKGGHPLLDRASTWEALEAKLKDERLIMGAESGTDAAGCPLVLVDPIGVPVPKWLLSPRP